MFLSKLLSNNPKEDKVTTPQRVVGIDMGSSSLKVVELENREGIVTLMTYGELQLGPYDGERPIGEVVNLSPQLERQALLDVLRESAVKAKSGVFAMPLSSSFVTVMDLPVSEKEEDLGPRIKVEAKKYIPMPIGEVTLDWAEVGRSQIENKAKEDNKEMFQSHVSILLAAIQNTALTKANDLKDSSSFVTAPTEIECFSTIRGSFLSEEEYIVVVDLGAISSKLYILRNGILQRMHRTRAGGSLCTALFAKESKLGFEEAEGLKKMITTNDKDFVLLQKIHHNHYEKTVHEFVKVIKDYEDTVGAKISKIILSGGGSLFPGLINFLNDRFEQPVVFATPFDKVAYPAFMSDSLRMNGPIFSTALGAALRVFE